MLTLDIKDVKLYFFMIYLYQKPKLILMISNLANILIPTIS